MANADSYASKMRRHDAIIDALSAAEDFIEHGQVIIEAIREHVEFDAPPQQAVPTVIELYGIMREELEPAWLKICKVEEWLTRAHSEIALRQNESLVIQDEKACFYTWHHAYLSEMSRLLSDIDECCDLYSPSESEEKLANNLGKLAEWCGRFQSNAISFRIATLRIECYRAAGLWEKSIRTDLDEESNSKSIAKALEHSTSGNGPTEKVRLLLRELNSNGMNYDTAIEKGLWSSTPNARAAKCRALRDYPDIIRSEFPNVARCIEENVTM